MISFETSIDTQSNIAVMTVTYGLVSFIMFAADNSSFCWFTLL